MTSPHPMPTNGIGSGDLPATIDRAWERGDDDLLRQSIIDQDARFRAAVIAAYPQFAPPPPPALVLRPARKRVRDLLDVSSGVKRKIKTISHPDYAFIVDEVAQKHGVTFGELCSRRRQQKIVVARQEVAWRLSKETSMSLPAIGKKLGGRDHTTIIYSIERHEQRMREAAEQP